MCTLWTALAQLVMSYVVIIVYMFGVSKINVICDLILENRPSCHIWYFEKY